VKTLVRFQANEVEKQSNEVLKFLLLGVGKQRKGPPIPIKEMACLDKS